MLVHRHMEARIVGILFLALSITLIHGLFNFLSVWAFFTLGILAGTVAVSRHRYWRPITLVVCLAYLLHQLPPLISLSVKYGYFHFWSVFTKTVFREGISASSIYNYWHIALMPLVVTLLCMYLIWSSIKQWWQKGKYSPDS